MFYVNASLAWTAILWPAISSGSDAGTEMEPNGAAVEPQPSSSGVPRIDAAGTVEPAQLPKIRWEGAASNGELDAHSLGAVQFSLLRESLGRWNVGGCAHPYCRSSFAGFHPGTRVIVDTSPFSTRTTAAVARALLRIQSEFRNRGYWPYRNCFENNSSERDFRGGDTMLRVQVAPSGAVTQTRTLATTHSSKSIAECVRNETRKLTVRSPNGKRAMFRLRIRLYPGDVPLPVVRTDAAHSATGSTALHDDAARPLRMAVERCISVAFQRDSSLWGRLSLALQLGDDGRVSEVREVESRFPDPNVLVCCRASLIGSTVPALVPGGELHIAARLGELPSPYPNTARPPQAMSADTPQRSDNAVSKQHRRSGSTRIRTEDLRIKNPQL